MTLHQLITNATDALSPSVGGDGEARAMIRLIMEHIKGYRPVDCVLHGHDEATPWLISEVGRIVRRVADGEPLQYVLGVARFMGNDFKVTSATLIPRPETAMLVDMITDDAGSASDLRVLDIGTGSGCIAISLAKALKFPEVTAIDICADAIEVAQANAQALKAIVNFSVSDIITAQPRSDSYDIIVSNPPYIARHEADMMEARVKDHEPHSALFVPDSDPLLFYRAIAAYSIAALRPAGKLYLEINPLYANQLHRMLEDSGFENIVLHRDFNDSYRFATAERPND